MIFHSNTRPEETLDWLRYKAIDGGMPSLFIDAIDNILLAPSEDEIADQINQAVEEAEKKAFNNGHADGVADKDNAVEDAEKAMYKACVEAIEAKGTEIGLTDEQVYKVINHILWDVRP